jgi:hypothetical protein
LSIKGFQLDEKDYLNSPKKDPAIVTKTAENISKLKKIQVEKEEAARLETQQQSLEK